MRKKAQERTPSTLRVINDPGLGHRNLGNYYEAEVMHRQVLEGGQWIFPEDHEDTSGYD
jgi:hypothetical protein